MIIFVIKILLQVIREIKNSFFFFKDVNNLGSPKTAE